MLYTVDSDKPLERIREALPRACSDHRFGVLSVYDMQEKLKEKGVTYGGAYRIYEVCNPHLAKRALEAEPAIATALPCRIAVYPAGAGKTRLATIRPTALAALYGGKGLADVASEVEQALVAILNDAAN
jgi:uncharacterized protein (DUF302 family)